MTAITRRQLVLGTSAAAIGAVVAVGYLQPFQPRPIAASRQGLLDLIAQEFGADIAEDPESRAFAADFSALSAAHGLTEVPQETAVFAFIRSTTVIRAIETGDALLYVGLEMLQEAPCRNTLSVGWL